MREPFDIAGTSVKAGDQVVVQLSVGSFGNHMPSTLPIKVIHGKRPGPTVFISAAIHGDEIIGVEIIRRLLRSSELDRLRGTLLCIPVVNTYGFIIHSRYLPDRRDLNRSFPGSDTGSLAGQLAHVFMTEVVARCDFGIDLHSAAEHRVNLPQVRYAPDSDKLKELAKVFGAPVALEAPLRPNSLRQAAREIDVDVLLYESGEALRLDEFAVRIGMRGILNILSHQGMIAKRKRGTRENQSIIASRSKWVRSPVGGILRAIKTIGDMVNSGDILGYVSDAFGQNEESVHAASGGVIIGRTNLPIVNPGDALFHIGFLKGIAAAEDKLSLMEEEVEADPLFDEDEII